MTFSFLEHCRIVAICSVLIYTYANFTAMLLKWLMGVNQFHISPDVIDRFQKLLSIRYPNLPSHPRKVTQLRGKSWVHWDTKFWVQKLSGRRKGGGD